MYDTMYGSSDSMMMNGPFAITINIISFIIAIATIIGWWKLFVKAGEPGWKAIVPFLNIYTYFRITGRNGWTLLLMFIPIVNLYFWIRAAIEMAHRFGKSTLYGVLALWLIPAIGAIDIGFGEAKYSGVKHQ